MSVDEQVVSERASWARPSLLAAEWYVPAEPAGDDWVSLNTNESPLPPSPAAVEAIGRAAAGARRYPDPTGEPLRSAIARHHGVTPDEVFVAAGADGVLETCFRAFCGPGDVVVVGSPTYPILHSYARIFSASLQVAPTPPVDEAWAQPGAALRIVVNPNVPTGTWVAPDVIAHHLGDVTGAVVFDEVYAPFAPASVIPLLRAHENWLAVRSFSKAYGLAGLRVGYGIGSPSLIADLRMVANPYLVGGCALAGALAALDDQDHHRRIVGLVRQQRGELAAALGALGWTVPESGGNFLFARPPGGHARFAVDALRSHGILVRMFPAVSAEHVRISVGSPAENERVLSALRALAGAWPVP